MATMAVSSLVNPMGPLKNAYTIEKISTGVPLLSAGILASLVMYQGYNEIQQIRDQISKIKDQEIQSFIKQNLEKEIKNTTRLSAGLFGLGTLGTMSLMNFDNKVAVVGMLGVSLLSGFGIHSWLNKKAFPNGSPKT